MVFIIVAFMQNNLIQFKPKVCYVYLPILAKVSYFLCSSRDVVQLVRDIQAACQRAGISEEELLCGVTTTNHHVPMASAGMSSTNGSSSSSSTAASALLPANDLEATYINAMRGLQYDSCDLPTAGHFVHHYAQSHKAAPALSKDTVRVHSATTIICNRKLCKNNVCV